jgi:signal transduction histidine kinase
MNPYSRKNSVGYTVGLGIGLTLSKMYVELHGGTIQVESEPGTGTSVSFTLPYRKK